MSLSSRRLILEGGNAVQDVERISRELIPETVDSVIKEIILPVFPDLCPEEIFVTGSTGKKPDSGDIDICVDIRRIPGTLLTNLLKLNEHLVKDLNIVGYINTILLDQIHIKWRQGSLENKFVQVDIMLSKNPDFVKFFACGDVAGTKYKLAHRNILLNSILFGISGSIEQADSTGYPLKWSTLMMTSSGIFKAWLTRLDENGNVRLWEGKPVTMEYRERMIMYIKDVRQAIDLMFGEDVYIEDIDNFEKVLKIIESPEFKYYKFKDKILSWAADTLKGNDKLQFPVELETYI